mgnify:CR=1 FL=1
MKKLLILSVILVLTAMSVGAKDCFSSIDAKSTPDFISSLPMDVSSCESAFPFPFRNERVQVNVQMDSGSAEQFHAVIEKGKLTSVDKGLIGGATYDVSVPECEFSALLERMDAGVAGKLYVDGKLVVKPVGFLKKMKFGVAKSILKRAAKRSAKDISISC